MSDLDDLENRYYDMGGQDENDDEEPRPVCNRCSNTDVEWVKTKTGWRLYTKGKQHECSIITKYRQKFG